MEDTTPQLRELTKVQRGLLIGTILPILAVGVMGGVGTYTNLSHVYGKGTALGALAAGEGATAVMAMILLITTALGQSAPRAVRVGLWLLPMAAAAMGATAATGIGQTIVYAITPMAITAAAEGLAFLTRRVVVHQVGRDVEAQARAAAVLKDLAYYQAVAAGHPDDKERKKAVKKSWKLARKVGGGGDPSLAANLMDVQTGRISQSADIALERMFTPGLSATTLSLRAVSAGTPLALLPASAGDATTPGDQESTIHADTSGYPTNKAPEQAEDSENVRPALSLVRAPAKKAKSLAADVRDMVQSGVDDVRVITDALATRHGREADDPKFKATVGRSFRTARAAAAAEADTKTDNDPPTGQYL
ncbi:conjugal transfer protein [Streptomyces ipomoeae]|uniref:conjugal transfer protein n=1 Tax=Streptomyces ipomoeae TaxID=103232 RepID=UPI0029AC859E|nr:conjugal transfer protein [Streptomyces ipomoeae]MDX2695930.1 conjugal transfer protein [Streptomyces ipomoeae]MDX2845790.1 conjugal transfer protein [Streptomyces ipomoeae]